MKKPERFEDREVIDKIGLILINQGHLLVVRSLGKDKFYIPGGKKKQGETDIEALCREVKEEISATVVKESILKCGTFEAQADGKEGGAIVNVTAFYSTLKGKLKAANEIKELAWVCHSDRERCSLVTQSIMDKLLADSMIFATKSF
jgi:8-oxo-dGTP diphosphatase